MKAWKSIIITRSSKILILLLILIFSSNPAFAQTLDSIKKDTFRSISIATDISGKSKDSISREKFLLTQQILQKHPYFNYREKAASIPYTAKKRTKSKELYFYALAGLLLFFASVRTAFSKYFDDMIALFFRRTVKKRQLKQQVSQNSLPSLLFNIFYVIIAGFYIALLIKEIGSSRFPFWELLIYSVAFLTVTYSLKYLILKLAGWLFHLKNLTDSYIFIVFLVNKIIGIMLLPVVVIMALANIEIRTSVLTLSWIALAAILSYRFVQAFGLLRQEKSISPFHFILYLLAFEILPVLVIYKAIHQSL